jgi:DNA-3-methyladenine glycosylase I
VSEVLPHGLVRDDDGRVRCAWQGGYELYRAYHDEEWGRPQANDHRLFEKLCLEGFQAGLSWLTILRKRERFREVFHGFDPAPIAAMGERDIERLLGDPGIVRHRGKIEAVIANAGRALDLLQERGSLAGFLWSFAPEPSGHSNRMDGETRQPVSETAQSRALSKELRRRGWRFVGPTTMHAFMQALGMVNDHLEGCFVREEVEAQQRAFNRPG